jgi:hypothetical protein
MRKWESLAGTVIGIGVATRPGSVSMEDRANRVIGALNNIGLVSARAPAPEDDSFPMPAIG